MRIFFKTKFTGQLLGVLLISSLLGCDLDQYLSDDEESQNLEVTYTVDSSPRQPFDIDFKFVQIMSLIAIKPIFLPQDLSSITCHINERIYEECQKAIIINPVPPSGQYTLAVSYVIENKEHYKGFYFSVEDGVLKKHIYSDKPQNPFVIEKSGPTLDFRNNSAVLKSQDISFDFLISFPEDCSPQLQCNRDNSSWESCKNSSFNHIEIESQNISLGFQTIRVKAICQDSQDESNILNFAFFGVTDQYEPMSLREIKFDSYYLYELERSLDCLGPIKYECIFLGSSDFQACSNLQREGLIKSIRAVCEKKSTDQIIIGPAF